MTTVCVATFNMRRGLGRDRRTDLERTARAIDECEAGFVALQEVDRNLRRSRRADQPAELARLTGMDVRFFPTIARDGGEYGIAVAAHGPLEVTAETLVRTRPDEEPRLALRGTWAGLSFVATHLSLVRHTRGLQLEALAAMARAAPGPVVVLGDLNARRADLDPLIDAGLDPGPAEVVTFVGRGHPRQLDHVLAGHGARVLRTWALESLASDHLPLVAEVRRRRSQLEAAVN
jgi:endonuclease/exonuclease/phosphatase family metal-dependent hydrolase